MYLEEKKKEIISFKQEIEALEEKKKQLKKLELDYYKNFYDASYRVDYDGKKIDYVLLGEFPESPINQKHVLHYYSVLNVDTIGKIICQLLKHEGIDAISERRYEIDIFDNVIHDRRYSPILVIGAKDEIDELNANKNNIIIPFEYNATLERYPTKTPITWNLDSLDDVYKRSNYNHLIGCYGGLTLDCPDKQKYMIVKQLIYSLAYHQKQHNMEQMTPSDTWNVYRKIYYKK